MSLFARQLCASYGRLTVFSDVTLAANPGEILAVLGPNGAGKSTLLRLFARLRRPTGGTITLAGDDLWGLSPAQAARAIAFTPQVLAPDWPLTVRAYVSLGRIPHRGWWLPLTEADRAIVDSALERLDISCHQARPIDELSGGEWQRVRLAKALAQEPRVLLLDEPTAHLDPRFQLELLALVSDLAQHDQLIVVVTMHDLNLVSPWAQRVALLARGRLLAEGSPSAVLTDDRLTAAYGVQALVARHPRTGALTVAFAGKNPPPLVG